MAVPEDQGPGSVVSWASAYAAQGKGPTEALRDFRAAGGQVREQTWFQAFGQVSGAIAGAEGLAALPAEAVPPDELVGEWQAGRPGVVYSQATVFVRFAGAEDVEPFFYTSISSGPRTKGAVLDEALDYVDTVWDPEFYGQFTVLGAQLTSMNRSR